MILLGTWVLGMLVFDDVEFYPLIRMHSVVEGNRRHAAHDPKIVVSRRDVVDNVKATFCRIHACTAPIDESN
jgi:hypothetical protein